MRTFFISDTHFGHKNIIQYENRPFENTDAMDAEMIKRWNNTVKNEDIVWFLGDFALNKKREEVEDLVHSLNGRKFLIMGNHDHYKVKDYYNFGFEYVSRYPVILKHHFILSHAPLEEMRPDDGYFYIFGHVHGSNHYATSTNNSRCVCVERQDYRPIRLSEYDNYTYKFEQYAPNLQK